MKSRPNIIYITIDALRFDHLGITGYRKNVSPFLDSLARGGAYFDRAYATGPGSAISSVGVFTSTYPFDHGGYSYVDRPRVLLSEVLQQNGYATYAFHSSPHLSGYYGHDRGWTGFHYLSNFKRGGVAMSASHVPGSRKAQTAKKVSAWKKMLKKRFPPAHVPFRVLELLAMFFRKLLKDIAGFRPPAYYSAQQLNDAVKKEVPAHGAKPVFLWVHYMDAHAPFGAWARRGSDIGRKFLFYLNDYVSFLFSEVPVLNRLVKLLAVHRYDDSIRHLDGRLKELFAHLKSAGLVTEDTIIVVHADHGEEFLEHGDLGHPQKLFNENIQVPLIINAPAFIKPERVGRPVSLIDVVPTLLDLVKIPSLPIHKGKNIFDASPRPVIMEASDCEGDLSDPVYTGAAIIDGGYKLIHWKDKKYLFSLDDRKEKKNVYRQNPVVAKELEKKLEPYTHPSWVIHENTRTQEHENKEK